MSSAPSARATGAGRPTRSSSLTTSSASSSPGARVVDLGCAPGGWSQVAVARVNALGDRPGKPVGTVLGVDLQVVEPIAGVQLHQLDFLEDGADDKVKAWLGGPADVVMCDMAAASSGHKQTDHLRIVALCEAAAQFAFDVLEDGGTFVAKVLAGGAEIGLQTMLKRNFTKVANVKPPGQPARTVPKSSWWRWASAAAGSRHPTIASQHPSGT